jgi:hypothetical protein
MTIEDPEEIRGFVAWLEDAMPIPSAGEIPQVVAEAGDRAAAKASDEDLVSREILRRAAIRDGQRRMVVLDGVARRLFA